MLDMYIQVGYNLAQRKVKHGQNQVQVGTLARVEEYANEFANNASSTPRVEHEC
jgi:hypothetical protein